jgi:hypothetical protein
MLIPAARKVSSAARLAGVFKLRAGYLNVSAGAVEPRPAPPAPAHCFRKLSDVSSLAETAYHTLITSPCSYAPAAHIP